MNEEKGPGRSRWQARVAGLVLLPFLVVALAGCRSVWIEPVPGVSLATVRAPVAEADLGPDSAYRLLLQACRQPAELADAPMFTIWNRDWTDAFAKVRHQPWPTSPPAPQAADPDSEPPTAADRWFDLPPDAPWTAEQYADVHRILGLHAPSVVLIDRALAAPNPRFPAPQSPDDPMDAVLRVRHRARVLALSAHCRAAEGDGAGAYRDLDRAVRIGNLLSRGGGLAHRLADVSCSEIACDAAWRIALRHEIPPAVLGNAARTLLDCADRLEPFAECVRADVTMTVASVPFIFRREGFCLFSGSGDASLCQRVANFAKSRLRGSSPKAVARNLRSTCQHLVLLAEEPYSETVDMRLGSLPGQALDASQGKGRQRVRDPMGFALAGVWVRFYRRVFARIAFQEASLRGTALFLAVQAYGKEHGRLPERLDQLVPGYLPRVPRDPFDGEPFRYLPNGIPKLPPETWGVYSIGKDFADDGGHARGDASGGAGPDLVWPSHAYPLRTPDAR